MNIPNAISLFRLCSVPLLVWLLLKQHFEWALWLFAVSAISDAVDGIIAKQFNLQTTLGGFLDPIADKALLVSAFITGGIIGLVPTWLMLLVVFRDLVIIGGAVVFETVTKSLEIEPLLISKINTLAQIILVLSALGHAVYAQPSNDIVGLLQYAVAFTTITSGAAYIIIWSKRAHLLEQKDEITRD